MVSNIFSLFLILFIFFNKFTIASIRNKQLFGKVYWMHSHLHQWKKLRKKKRKQSNLCHHQKINQKWKFFLKRRNDSTIIKYRWHGNNNLLIQKNESSIISYLIHTYLFIFIDIQILIIMLHYNHFNFIKLFEEQFSTRS